MRLSRVLILIWHPDCDTAREAMGPFYPDRIRLWVHRLRAGLTLAFAFGLSGRISASELRTFEQLKSLVLKTAGSPYVPPAEVPAEWTGLSYVDYARIQFRAEKALWRNREGPFQIEFMHPGYVHRHSVWLSELTPSGEERLSYSTNLFTYSPQTVIADLPEGFAGFKVISTATEFREIGSFIGASYFRFLGTNQVYGLSARGLALNVLEREEFPMFRRFWLERPQSTGTELRTLALLDSPSIVGGFEFRIASGATAITRVKAFLKPRSRITELGMAPLTSMFLHDDNGRDVHRDFRPEVHDSDGLLLHTGKGLWIWRPLDKGRMLRVNAYADENPQGFGLLQRDRDFRHYEDPIASFERRPSAWVEPEGNWGKGAVVLVQLPSDREFSDNVVVYWRPDRSAESTDSWQYEYSLSWTTNRIVPPALATVVSSRVGIVAVEPPPPRPNLRFVIDLGGGSLKPASELKAVINVGSGAQKVADSLYYVRETGLWRLVIEITHPLQAVELSAFLQDQSQPVSERWTYTWQP